MALTSPDSLRTKGAKTAFHQAMGNAPEVWKNHCQIVSSETNAETYAFPGFMPEPRLLVNSRQFQNFLDFSFVITNNSYELSVLVNREHFEDDQTGLIRQRFTELGEVFGTFKDNVFAQLLAAGKTANSWDGTVFYHTDHSAGSTGQTNDNDLTFNATSTTAVTPAELKTILNAVHSAGWGFLDDTGRPFNGTGAMNDIRLVCSAGHFGAALEVMSDQRAGDSGGTSTVATRAQLHGVDILPYIATGEKDELYFTINGASRRGFIMQQRDPVEILVLDGKNDIAENNAVKVLCRERFTMAYGDTRRSILETIT